MTKIKQIFFLLCYMLMAFAGGRMIYVYFSSDNDLKWHSGIFPFVIFIIGIGATYAQILILFGKIAEKKK